MKKLLTIMLAVLLAAAMTFALTGCSVRELHIGQVEVNTGAGTAWITPARGVDKFDIPAADFSAGADGSVTYTGTAYRALQGIDVSTFQQDIDWQRVAASGVQFAILRAGYRGYTEGSIQEDSYFEQNLAGAIDAGLDVGVYFFSQAINEAEAVEEAQFCMDLLQDYSITYPIVFDWEPYDSSLHPRTEGLSDEMLTKCAVAFCQAVEANGYDSMVYSNLTYFYLHYDLSKLVDFPLWLAQYNKTPTFYYHFDMWQYSSTGKVPGIEGNVDLNIQMIPKT